MKETNSISEIKEQLKRVPELVDFGAVLFYNLCSQDSYQSAHASFRYIPRSNMRLVLAFGPAGTSTE